MWNKNYSMKATLTKAFVLNASTTPNQVRHIYLKRFFVWKKRLSLKDFEISPDIVFEDTMPASS